MRPRIAFLIAAAAGWMHAIARAEPSTTLRKADIGPAVKRVVPQLTRCYQRAHARDPQVSGVINTKLTARNDPKRGMTLRVRGFATSGPLGESRAFLACVTRTFESATLAPLATRGSLDLVYPTTFAPQSPDNHDTTLVDSAKQAARDARWSDALHDAERGLELTSLDGTYRRPLIEIAGLAACHVKDEAKARFYFELAPPWAEAGIQQVCHDAGIELAPG